MAKSDGVIRVGGVGTGRIFQWAHLNPYLRLMDRARLFIQLKKGDNHLEVLKRATATADGKLDEFLSEFEKSMSLFKP